MERMNHWLYARTGVVPAPLHLLVFEHDIDMVDAKDAVEQYHPIAVIPPWDLSDSRQHSMNAHTMRSAGAPVGIVAFGRHARLLSFLEWVYGQGYAPVVLHGLKPIHLWQYHQQRTWHHDAWYHYCADEPHNLPIPGRWTWGADFVGALNGGTKV
jgi:hypothetical protein